MQFSPYVIPFIIPAVVLATLAVYSWKYRYRRVAKLFSLTMITTLIWTLGFILEIVSSTLGLKLFWADIQFLGIAFLPVTWLLMVIYYTGGDVRSRTIQLLLFVPPILTNIIIWTNGLHHLFRLQPYIDYTSAAFPVLVNDYGPWFFWVHSIHGNLLFIISFYFLLRSIMNTREMYRKQGIVLLSAGLIPLTVDLLYIVGYSPIPDFNLTIVFFSLSGIAIGWILIKYRFLDLIPIARTIIVDSLEDAWFVVDDTSRIIDLNEPAVVLFDKPRRELIGSALSDALGPRQDHYTDIIDKVRLQTEIKTTKGADYELRILPLRLSQGDISGRLVLLRDISLRKNVEREREQMIVELKEALERVKTLSELLPICSNCKKIRDDEGYWHEVESYISKYSDTVFSHGICPDCMKELNPKFSKRKKKHTKEDY